MENEKIEEVIISEFAEEDLNEIAEYYFSRSPDYVERIISEFEDNVMSLQEHPKSGRKQKFGSPLKFQIRVTKEEKDFLT